MRDLYKIASGFRQNAPEIRVRFGSVVSVQTGRTATVTVGGSTEQISGIPYLESMVPLPGAVVVMLTDGVDLFIVDHISDTNMTLSPRAYRSGNVTVGNGADTLVDWAAVNNDPWGCWSGTNASRLTAPVDGRYMAIGVVRWVANSTGMRAVWITSGGVDLARNQVAAAPSGITALTVVTPPTNLNKGEYIQMYVRQSSGGNLDLVRDSQQDPSLSLVYLG